MRFQVKSPSNGQLRRYERSYVGDYNIDRVNDIIGAARRGYPGLVGGYLRDPEVVDRVQQLLYREADSRMFAGAYDPYRFDCGDVLSVVEVALRSIEEEKES